MDIITAKTDINMSTLLQRIDFCVFLQCAYTQTVKYNFKEKKYSYIICEHLSTPIVEIY